MNDPRLRFEVEGGAVVELDLAALRSLEAGDGIASPWRVATPPDWQRYQALRLLAANFGDDTVAALVALRPAGAEGHDAEEVTAVLVDDERGAAAVGEALLSTELDAERRVRRVGVELWTSEHPPPRRLAADRTRFHAVAEAGIDREATLMEAHLDGATGSAVFETLRPSH